MRSILICLGFLFITTQTYSQKRFRSYYDQKLILGVEFNLSPLGIEKYEEDGYGELNDLKMGLGAGIILEYIPLNEFSIAIDASINHFLSFDGGASPTLAPIVIMPRLNFAKGFYMGPKGGLVWAIAGDSYAKNPNLTYGFGIGIRTKRQKMNVELGYQAIGREYYYLNEFKPTTFHTLYFSYRLYFLKNLKKVK